MKEYFTIEESMKGKVAFMTGGTTGIGRATVTTFVQAGVNVVFVGRSEDKGKEIEKELNALGKGEATYMKCDVTDFPRLEECIEETYKKYGRLDTLFNCAGIFPPQKPADKWTIDEFMWILNTNLVSYFVAIRKSLPYIRQTKGVIINVGSVLGLQGDEGACPYTATKGAIATMTRTLACDEARHGVRVVEIKPGHINTEMFFKTTSEQSDPEGFVKYSDSLQWMNRGGEPEEIAYTALFLASDWASFITGTDILVTGGYEIGEGPKPINPFLASNKDENGIDLYPDQRPMMDWIKSLKLNK
jgi:NAD(P)-dependent dehydrogenase (short-subunit alcohol dehydrogenase family)